MANYKRAFRKLGTDDEASSRVQDNIGQAIEPLLRSQLSDGVLLRGVALKAGSFTDVAHRLSRAYVGWFITKQSANIVVWEEGTNFSDRFVRLRASADTTVDLWVF